jgi:hypothetical protein
MKKQLTWLTTFILLLAVLAACGASSRDYSGVAPQQPVEVIREAASAENEAAGGVSYDAATQPQAERMIIWNADIVLTVKDTKQVIDDVQTLARQAGGYAVGTESWLDNEQLYARLTIRIPAGKFEQTMAGLRALALEVVRESATSEDVTEEYVDLTSRLKALEAKEAQLTALMERAEDTEAVLAVYEQLSATQIEIEQVKGRMKYLETLSAMATITVNLNPEPAEPQILEEGWKPFTVVREAARSLVDALKGLGNLVIWLIIFALPILLVLAIPVVIVLLIIRRARRRKRAKTPDAPSA